MVSRLEAEQKASCSNCEKQLESEAVGGSDRGTAEPCHRQEPQERVKVEAGGKTNNATLRRLGFMEQEKNDAEEDIQ